METGIQSSFIPQDAGKVSVTPRQVRSSGGLGDLIFLIALVLLVVSIALAGGVFIYKQYLDTTAKNRVQQLERAREAFEPALIQQLIRLDDRMRASDAILGAHIAPTAFFLALAQATLTTVSFSSLDFDATDPKKITIKMPGVARSVNSIALQADIMSKNGVFISPIFSAISRQSDGVHFDLTASVNPATVNYVSLIAGAVRALSPEQQQGPQPIPETQQTVPTGTPQSGEGASGAPAATQGQQGQGQGSAPAATQKPITQ